MTTDRDSRVATLVFTDLVDSTRLKTQFGDRRAGELISRHQQQVQRLAAELGGREVDSAGDGFFLTFDTPSAATRFGLLLQLEHAQDRDLPEVRVGIHMGEVSERAAPPGASKPTLVEGLAVDLAARIQGLALPGQVLLSAAVFTSARQRVREDSFERPLTWLT